jgi:hypothetical protein
MGIAPPEKTREPYSEEDQKLLISLLLEYSGKLVALCDEIEIYRAKKVRQLLFVSLFIAGFCYAIYLDQRSNIPEIVLFSVWVTVLFVYSYVYWYMFKYAPSGSGRHSLFHRFSLPIYPTYPTEERLIREAKLISKKLEKVIRIVSQIQDHSLRDIPSRIEMDFRLTDAELVLERSLTYAKQK